MSNTPAQGNHYSVVIIGAGTAGVAVASSLRRALPRLDIAVVEPSQQHYYQPAWTLVGGGQYEWNKTRRDVQGLLPGVERQYLARQRLSLGLLLGGDVLFAQFVQCRAGLFEQLRAVLAAALQCLPATLLQAGFGGQQPAFLQA